MSTTRTITSYGVADSLRVSGLTRGPGSGWSWDGTTLIHHLMRITVTADAAARITAALATAKPSTSERLTGY
jgi:hypothetical protein